MATKQTADDAKVQKSKTVNIVAYLSTPEDGNKYERLAHLFDDERVLETETNETTDWKFVSGSVEKSVRNTTATKMMECGVSFDDGFLVDKGDSYTRRVLPVDELVFGIALDSWDSVKYGVDGKFYSSGVTDNSILVRAPSYRRKLRITGSFSEDMGLLKHMSDMTSGDRYEDKEADLDAVTFTVDIKEQEVSSFRYLSEVIVPRFVGAISTDPRVDRVRVQECTETTAEEGVCFGI